VLRPNDSARIRRLRATILTVAHMAAATEAVNPDDPYTLSRNVLVGTLDQAGELPSAQDLRNAVRYLETKGALEVVWRMDGTGEFEKFRLRALGIDLVEGAASDPAIQFTGRRDG
jgi:hypothetical protein